MMLQLFCEKLDVAALGDVVPALQTLTVAADACPRLEQVRWAQSVGVIGVKCITELIAELFLELRLECTFHGDNRVDRVVVEWLKC